MTMNESEGPWDGMELPRGVSSASGRFVPTHMLEGKLLDLGEYDTPAEAASVYEYFRQLADDADGRDGYRAPAYELPVLPASARETSGAKALFEYFGKRYQHINNTQDTRSVERAIDAITVGGSRQRQDLGNLRKLADSISQHGLLHPITVDSSGTLIAGERRLEACKSLGWTSIAVRIVDVAEGDAPLIELAENLRRKNLHWKEESQAIFEYSAAHNLGSSALARKLCESETWVADRIVVGAAVAEGNEQVLAYDKFSGARNFLQREADRKRSADRDKMDALLTEPPMISDMEPSDGLEGVDGQSEGEGETPQAPGTAVPYAHTGSAEGDIVWADFHNWIDAAAETKGFVPFNVVHCDFPFGINMHEASQATLAAGDDRRYDDTEETYRQLLQTLMAACERGIIAKTAHMLFWFSMHHYAHTKLVLESFGWRVRAKPLVWVKSDNVGQTSDTQREPRSIYETALFCTRGNRKIVKVVADAISAPAGAQTKRTHPSEKPVEVLKHFFRLFCDSSARVLDPTCGSGTAITTAAAFGAERALGLEIDYAFARAAQERHGYDGPFALKNGEQT